MSEEERKKGFDNTQKENSMKMKNKQTKEGGCLEEGGVGRKWTRRVRTPNLLELLGGFKEEK